ncbi:Uracil-DNA glycosylase [Penicillium taxi]|uniref:Uracil-DNA glycosylase n=1 Tax=Penicillium taxi TaxID=168475 RepID=UPI002544FBC2|nr:Uracil-DNA glycosylase [Penicillium taxi]KAJ5894444.1 Uracil-DNA glycosylase [Penicillium taxi]
MTSPDLKRKADSSTITSSKKPKDGNITSFFGAPKKPKTLATQTVQSITQPSSFNKEKWVASLTPEQKELLQLEIDTLHVSWLAHLKEELVTSEFLNLKRFLKAEKESKAKIFPPEEDIYSCVKVVIIGQDPYHNDNQAHGLCFSVRPPTRAPPSLVNIYKGIKMNYPDFTPPPNNSGLLTPWAERGVLMLNTCLTVRAHQANSHSNKGWEKFTQKAIDLVARVRTRGVVFLAWGTPAGTRVAKINREKHCFENGHFKKCNDWLASRYGDDEIIDWSLVPTKKITPAISNKENSSTLANITKVLSEAGPETDSNPAKPLPSTEFDEFDDAEALEALVAADQDI